MEPKDRIAELLAEIRDIQQAHYTEYQRTSQEFRDLNQSVAKQYEDSAKWSAKQYEDSAKWSRAWTWGLFLLVALGFAVNTAMLVEVRETARAMQLLVEGGLNEARR